MGSIDPGCNVLLTMSKVVSQPLLGTVLGAKLAGKSYQVVMGIMASMRGSLRLLSSMAPPL